MKSHQYHIQFTELLIAPARLDERYYGTIQRLRDENDVQYVFSEISVFNCFFCARAPNQVEPVRRLDEMGRFALTTVV